MTKLNIAMFSVHSCPLGRLGARDTGGMNVYIRELSSELGRRGHKVDIFTRAHDPRDAQVDYPSENVRVIHIQAGPVEDMGKMSQYSHIPDFIDNTGLFLQCDGSTYDIVQSHYWLSGCAGMVFAGLWGIPHAVMFHTLGAVKNLLPVGEPESPLRLAAEMDAVKKSHLIIAATEQEKEILRNRYSARENRTSVIPCGVNTSLFIPCEKAHARAALGFGDGKIILYVGRIEALKGIENLIRAVAVIRESQNAKLLVIGGDEHSQSEVSRLNTIINDLKIECSIDFLGAVPQERLPLYYNAADVSVVASHYESFCLVILESLACGTPVVSTPVGVAPEVIRQGLNGVVIKDNESRNIADGLDKMLGADNICRTDIRKTVLKYDWESIAASVESEYLDLAAAKGESPKARP